MVDIGKRLVRENGWFQTGLKPVRVLQELPGIILECRVIRGRKPIRFKDWAGFAYWQHPGDNVRLNWRRRAVSDATHIIRYVLGNVRAGSVCIDIGAHYGSVSVALWSRVGPTGRVISVEADPENAERLRANLRLNGFTDRWVTDAALTDTTGTVQLRCFPGSSGWQTLGDPAFARNRASFTKDVPAIDFQRLASIHGFGSVDFVKIDVEGAELVVLSSMHRYLRDKKIGCVVFEVNGLMLEGMGHSVPQLMAFWKDLDYDLWRITESGTLDAIGESWTSQSVGDCIAVVRT
jgi:FkbM family methyltransferase